MQNFVYLFRCNALKMQPNALTQTEKKQLKNCSYNYVPCSVCLCIVNMHLPLTKTCLYAAKNGCKQWQPIGFISQMGKRRFFVSRNTILLNRLLCHCFCAAIMNFSINGNGFFFRWCIIIYVHLHLLVGCQILGAKLK